MQLEKQAAVPGDRDEVSVQCESNRLASFRFKPQRTSIDLLPKVAMEFGENSRAVFRWSGIRNSNTDERLRGVAWGDKRFVAVGYAGTILTSKDGVRWTLRYSSTEQRLQNVAFGGGRFVVAGRRGEILTSSKGLIWTPRKSGTASDLSKVTWTGGLFVVVGKNQTILTSTNGLSWRSAQPAHRASSPGNQEPSAR